MTSKQTSFKRKIIGFRVFLVFLFFAFMAFGVFKTFASAQDRVDSLNQTQEGSTAGRSNNPEVIKFAFLAAAIAVGVGSVGAGAAVGYVGAAAMGAIGEKPELSGRALIFVGLAEGIAIYGLIIAIMILGKV